MDINVSTVGCTIIVFVLRLLAVVLLTGLLNNYKKRGANFAIAWMFFYLYQMTLMLILSLSKQLYSKQLLISLVIGIIAISIGYFWVRRKGEKQRINYFCSSDVIPLTIMLAFCIYCMVRAFVYFDSTPDANVYGMSRIFLFSTQGSLFENMGTLSKNIFVNEWNGELNAIFYRIISGDNISIPFANIEIYFYALFSFIFLGKDLYKEKRYGIYMAYLVMFLPVVVFLAFTCKGDLLGIITFVLFVLLLLLCWRECRCGIDADILLCGAIVAGAIASGARITIIPAVGLIMLIVLGDFLFQRQYKKLRMLLCCSLGAYVIGWARYIINFIYYGNLFERVDVSNEKIAPSASRFFATTASWLEDTVMGENIFTHEGIVYALSADAGIVGSVLIFIMPMAFIYCLVRLKQQRGLGKKYWREIGMAASVLFSFLFTLCSMDYYQWSFRYYAPYLVCFLVGSMYILNYVKNRKVVSVCWMLIAAFGTISAYSTIEMTKLEGEVTGDTWDNMLQKGELERRYAFHEWLLEHPEGKSDINDFYDCIRQDKDILVCHNIDQMISWCWGDNASNAVTLCLPEEFAEYCFLKDWDAIVIGQALNLDKSFIPSHTYKEYVPYYLGLEVYIRQEMYRDSFHAHNYSDKLLSSGLYAFDGYACWLNMEASLPIQMDVSHGVKIIYEAGLDLMTIDPMVSPNVTLYIDGRFFCSEEVTYTGEYIIEVPAEFFDATTNYHVFEFNTNATIGVYGGDGGSYSIRLKAIEPMN
uniref:hypothetical protein n=1 Tax=Acetatifactor sp. TaxID=1872090 RepID=UPI004056BA50